MQERKIVVGYDPEHGGPDVVRLGRRLAEVLAATPVVVSALAWPSYLLGVEDLQRQVDAELGESLESARSALAGLDPKTRAVASASVAETLIEVASEEGAQLIVLGSSHRGALGRTLAGSVGESLMHGAPNAIAVAPLGYADQDEHLQRIGVAFDGSPEAWTALETAIGIAERCHGAVELIAVADYPRQDYAAAWSTLAMGEIRDYEREDKERLLDLAAARVPDALPYERRLLTGDAATALAEASTEVDLLVSGSRAYGPLRRTLLGSTTRKLIRSASCPVLVLPRGSGVDPLGLRQGARLLPGESAGSAPPG